MTSLFTAVKYRHLYTESPRTQMVFLSVPETEHLHTRRCLLGTSPASCWGGRWSRSAPRTHPVLPPPGSHPRCSRAQGFLRLMDVFITPVFTCLLLGQDSENKSCPIYTFCCALLTTMATTTTKTNQSLLCARRHGKRSRCIILARPLRDHLVCGPLVPLCSTPGIRQCPGKSGWRISHSF